jgi:tRNA threonylcarbamoyladenosine biosynthesis protein TsaE
MTPATIHIPTLRHLPRAAAALVPYIRQYSTLAFYGTLGAGKTTLIRALCHALDVTDPVNSPTFAILNQYRTPYSAHPICHFDFYRIHTPDEALALGLDELFYTDALCLIEWPENIEPLLPPGTLCLHLTVLPDGARQLYIPTP